MGACVGLGLFVGLLTIGCVLAGLGAVGAFVVWAYRKVVTG